MSVPAPPRPERVAGTGLARLAEVSGTRLIGPDPAVTGVSLASDRLRPGDLFAALPGERTHGARYAPAALAAGAVAVLTDREGVSLLADGTAVLLADDPRAALAPVSAEIYGRPDRRLAAIGMTGTSGKTTTTTLIRAGLAAAGATSGLIGTLGTFSGGGGSSDVELTTGLTTPESSDLFALLAVLVERGCSHVVMEVSSHALVQHRVDGMRFAAAGFTNLSQDHLDFHPDMEDYFAAKARLFDGRAERQAIVVDDEWGRRLAARTSPERTVTVSTTSTAGDWRAEDVVVAADGSSSFVAVGPHGRTPAATCIPGAYNVANALLALAVLDGVGVPPAVAAPAIATAQVPGRMERIDAGQDFAALVDYAHKPAAVTGALRALRPLTAGRLIVVLGCGGDRDRGKRPMMGAAAAAGADVFVATDDNPRREDPDAIRAAMLAGVADVPPTDRAEVLEIGSRAEAITAAVGLARPGDTVLVAGKGHEPGQEINGVKHPFDDRVVLRAAIAGSVRR